MYYRPPILVTNHTYVHSPYRPPTWVSMHVITLPPFNVYHVIPYYLYTLQVVDDT